MSRSLRTVAATAVLVFAVALGAARADGPIGVEAAVQPVGVGTPPAGAPRPLTIGQPVVFAERIATEAAGRTQILFRDQSTLTVGPNSSLVIDQFVYDPNAGTGKLAMSATRGVFRFVGGKLSKTDNGVTLDTAAGSLGIRGGIFVARITPNGGLTAVFVYGKEMTVTGRNGAVTRVRRPGYAVSIDRAGNSPSEPFVASRELLATLVGQFDGVAVSPSEVNATREAADSLLGRLDRSETAGQPGLLAERVTEEFLPAHPWIEGFLAAHPAFDFWAERISLHSIAVQGSLFPQVCGQVSRC